MKRGVFLFVFAVLIVSSASALTTYKQYENISIQHPVRINGGIGSNVFCNISIINPNGTFAIDFLPMTDQVSYHNYTFESQHTGQTGMYNYFISCDSAGMNQTSSFQFLINPTGIEPSDQRTEAISRSIYFIFGFSLLFFLSTFFIKSKPPVRWTLFIFGTIFFLIAVNTIMISMKDEVVNPRLEVFFGSFLVLSWYFYYAAALFLIVLWIFTFVNTWMYKRNLSKAQRAGLY